MQALDELDRDIIAMLSRDGRQPNTELARQLGVSEGTVRKRLDRLVESGAITIHAIVEPTAVGLAMRALFLVNAEPSTLGHTISVLCAMPEVLYVARVAGEFDLVLEAAFATQTDLATYADHRLSQAPGVTRAQIAHVLDVPKHYRDWVPPDPTRPRILVVDDDPDFCEVVRMVLETERFEVRSASSGREAVNTMLSAPPDLVILDIMMDGVLDGWDASWRMRQDPSLRQIPILVVSSITTSDYRSFLPTDQDNLIENFLSKPVPPEKLVAEVRRLLRRR